MRRHSYGCNCRDCVRASLWFEAICAVAFATLVITALIQMKRSGLFDWLTN